MSRWSAILFSFLLASGAWTFGCDGEGGSAGGDDMADVDEIGEISPACALPNPVRAVVSEELVEPYDWLEDGSFESGEAVIELYDHPVETLSRASVERSQAAARIGSWGYAVVAEAGEGIQMGIRSKVEKGEDMYFTAWLRSPGGTAQVVPLILWMESLREPRQVELLDPLSIGTEWTRFEYQSGTTTGDEYVLMAFEVGPNTTIYLDDAQVELPQWHMAEYEAEEASRVVGGIPVPAQPAAPVHFNVLIHIEDPPAIHTNQLLFHHKTAVFRELARILHEHGGFLTIQPEEDWPMAAEAGFYSGLLAELADQYDVVYSTHVHGPSCRDNEGRLRSAQDCQGNPTWDRQLDNDDVIEYVGALRDLLEDASGIGVTDHNGSWDFTEAGRFAEIPMLTWSAYKSHITQRTYDRLLNNPWRPTEGNPIEAVETFLIHDPQVGILYIPGWGQAITRHPERLTVRVPAILSQFIRFADPDRVNSAYIVTHVDHYASETGRTDYVEWDPGTGEYSYSEEFLEDLGYWETLLEDTIDPLVAEGYLQWTSLPEIGDLFVQWETACVE